MAAVARRRMTSVGASGTVEGTTAADGAESMLVPSALVAATVKV